MFFAPFPFSPFNPLRARFTSIPHLPSAVTMSNRVFTVRGKIQKEQGKAPSALETSVAQALYDIQANPQAKDLGEALKPLFILSATQALFPFAFRQKCATHPLPFPSLD